VIGSKGGTQGGDGGNGEGCTNALPAAELKLVTAGKRAPSEGIVESMSRSARC
jgi:hypothetical protein